MLLLDGLRVVQIGDGLAAAVCGRLLTDAGADVLSDWPKDLESAVVEPALSRV